MLRCAGGQIDKGFRRFGVPGVAAIGVLVKKIREEKKRAWMAVLLFLLIPLLCMGYGVDSWLVKIFKKEWTVRLVYGTIVSTGACGLVIVVNSFCWSLIAYWLVAVAVFQIRGGKLFTIGKFDLLVEDLARGAGVGMLLGRAVV